MRALSFGLVFALLAQTVAAEQVGVRVGNHAGFGRVVLDLSSSSVPYRVERAGERISIHLPSGALLEAPTGRPPRNVREIAVTGEQLLVLVRPGARLREQRLGHRLVLDVLDPVPAASTRAEARPGFSAPLPDPPPAAPAERGPDELSSGGSRTANPAPRRPPVDPSPPRPAPDSSPPILPVPNAISVRVARSEAGVSLVLPVPGETSVAALRRGDVILVVLDTPLPLDLSALRQDAILAGAETAITPDATVLSLRVAAPAALQTRREADAWIVTVSHSSPAGRTISAVSENKRLVLRAEEPGRTVPILDPVTGLPLLVGTVQRAGQATPSLRRLPEAELLPTFLGVAVLALGDTASLRRSGDRFLLLGVAGGTELDIGLPGEAAAMSRMFDFPRLETSAAQERLRTEVAGIASAAPLARLGLRRGAAESLLALGLASEAQAMLDLAFGEDPRAARDPHAIALHAAAALVAGRLSEAEPFLAVASAGLDEWALWRGLLLAARGEGAAGASEVASTYPILLTYPEPLRSRLLPLAVEALMEADERGPLRRLLTVAGEAPMLALARARLDETEGRVAEALGAYDDVARGRDRLARIRALRRAVDLRHATGALDAAAAAAALEVAFHAWRGDAEEWTTRLRSAELRRAAGQPRLALATILETAQLFPDRAAEIALARETAYLEALTREPPPVALALAEAHQDLMPRDGRGAEALMILAERVTTMDLPEQASRLLRRGLRHAPEGLRPLIGARLAAAHLAVGDATAALDALAATAGAGTEVLAEREILAARALQQRGDEAGALQRLRSAGPAGLPLLAELLVARQDWRGASDALGDHASKLDPADQGLPRLIVRSAALAALASDKQRLQAIRDRWTGRIPAGSLADALSLLTSDPVRGLSDLPRLQRELDLFRGIPGGLEAFRTAAASSR